MWFIDYITDAMDNNKARVDYIYTDFSKAFDKSENLGLLTLNQTQALSLNKSPAERNNSFFCTHRDSLMDSTFSKNEITDSSGVPLKDRFHLYGKIGLGLEKTGAGGILSTGVLVAGETFSSSSASNLKRSRSKRCFMAS
nr:unnamed protein product [Callosobruchus analis]